MKLDEKCLRISALALLAAVLIHLSLPHIAQAENTLARMLIFLESGRWVTPVTQAIEQPPLIQKEDPVLPVFSPQEAEEISLYNPVGYQVDTENLLVQPLQWNLKTEAPTVLILHSHATESYENTENYQELPDVRTLDPHYNMISIGDALAACLEQAGIGVIHDRTHHDYPSYNSAYGNARTAMQAYLDQYPSIQLVLDLHRDAYEDSQGNQLGYSVDWNGQSAAQLMLVVGTYHNEEQEPDWYENLALATKIQIQLQRTCPGIARPISIRSSHFNQDCDPRALLVEVGAAGNTRQEAILAVQALAQSIIALSMGSRA